MTSGRGTAAGADANVAGASAPRQATDSPSAAPTGYPNFAPLPPTAAAPVATPQKGDVPPGALAAIAAIGWESDQDGSAEVLAAAADVFTDNAALALAAPVFHLLVKAQSAEQHDAASLHKLILAKLSTFEQAAAARGLSAQHVQLTLYALAATADDIVLHTPWGKDSDWSSQTMISTYFQETWGGERFFALLQQMRAAPHAVFREIEFYYFCIQFGFQGRFRLAPGGASELLQIRDELYHYLRSVRGTIQSELSPAWRGIPAARAKPVGTRRYWIAAGAVLLGLGALFGVFTTVLMGRSLKVAQGIEDLMDRYEPTPLPAAAPAPALASTPAPAPPPAQVAAPAPVPVAAPSDYQVISSFLKEEQDKGLLKVFESNGKVVIRTTDEVFATASTSLRSPYPEVVKKIAGALNGLAGTVDVLGYTDDVPIRSSTYPDNEALSAARAKRVADQLIADNNSNIQATPSGRGAADPVASNETAEGRQANRRVEVVFTPKDR